MKAMNLIHVKEKPICPYRMEMGVKRDEKEAIPTALNKEIEIPDRDSL